MPDAEWTDEPSAAEPGSADVPPTAAELLALLPHAEESEPERAARVARLAALVRGGAYAVHTHRLAVALLDWDPRRGAPKAAPDVADRRRAYMREYMRRRRAADSAPSFLAS